MKYCIVVCLFFLLSGCGKSPLQMKKTNDVSGSTGIEIAKTLKTTQQSLALNWLSPVNSTDEAHALLIAKKNGVATDLPDQVKIFLWMPTMGHGSSPITIKKLGTGLYDLSQVYFIMDGFWQLRIQLKNGNEVIDEEIFEINI